MTRSYDGIKVIIIIEMRRIYITLVDLLLIKFTFEIYIAKAYKDCENGQDWQFSAGLVALSMFYQTIYGNNID